MKCADWLAKKMERGFDSFKAKSISEFYSLHAVSDDGLVVVGDLLHLFG